MAQPPLFYLQGSQMPPEPQPFASDTPSLEQLAQYKAAARANARHGRSAFRDFFLGGPAEMEPDLVQTQQGVEPQAGQSRRPGALPLTVDAETGWPQLAMPRLFDLAGNVAGGLLSKVPAGGTVLGAGPVRRAGIGHNNPPPDAKFARYAEEYPAYGDFTYEPRTAYAKEKGIKDVPQAERALDPERFYPSKVKSAEGVALDKERAKIQAEINKGNYEPFFDPAKRADVDPANYPAPTDTLAIQPKKAKTIEDARAKLTGDPEVMTRLRTAFEAGEKLPDAKNWYFMKQLEDEFVRELGPVAGREAFRDRFAGSMAATTGGADPNSNWLMAHFTNYLRGKGQPMPEKSYQTPVGVGGRYGVGDWKFGPYDEANPKRHNFQYNFLGHRDKATMDEQMSQILMPGKNQPTPGQYGLWEETVQNLAKQLGVDPRYLQEVAWAGAKHLSETKKKGEAAYAGKPMISTINESIERTHKLTGMPKEEIVRRGVVRSEIPMYGQAPVPSLNALQAPQAPQAGPQLPVRYDPQGRPLPDA